MTASKTVIAFDPGLREAGLAVFKDGVLTFATLVQSKEKKARGGRAWWFMGSAVRAALVNVVYLGGEPGIFRKPFTFVSEIPQVYREGKSANVDPEDLTNLTGVVGAVIGFLDPDEVETYVPAQWKGQVPKEIHNRRIIATLTPNEQTLLANVKCPVSLKHNVVDAVGIGLFALGRMGGVMGRLT
jgi:hypothetical protein